ncbi:cell envelope biogenesis protein LolA [Methylosinus sp. 3S-1]|nr:cell envelope biogenesis protein LolA [Methylosinus sp. 3S-1]
MSLAFLPPLASPAGAELFQPWPTPTQVKPAPRAAAKPAPAKPAKAAAKPAHEKPAAKTAHEKPAHDKTAHDKAPAKTEPKTAAAKPSDGKPSDGKPVEGKAASTGATKADAAKAATATAAAAAAAAVPQKPLDRAEAIKRAEASLNASPVMTADFVQIGGDGRRAEGRLFIHKVGRMRFEYAQPATMEVVSDGVTVAVRDRKLNTQDLYFIAQTPLKFLLNEKIDLEKDVKLLDVVIDDAGAAIIIEDKATLGGTSKIKLLFDAKTFDLKQWQVTDPQGYETLVSLFNIDRDSAPDPKLFKVARD